MSSVPISADLQFSIVVVARDEAIALPRLCYQLEDFIERGDELLVMDTGSTDDTVAIAKHRGCRVELVGERYAALLTPEQAAAITERFAQAGEGPLVRPGERMFNFGEARQDAGLLASNDFVLQLDANDEVSALDIDGFNELIGSQRAGGLTPSKYPSDKLVSAGKEGRHETSAVQ
jgi:glycosyltransferase involved in cell wall biosynthesis